MPVEKKESVVTYLDAVCGQKQDSLEVLQLSEKDADESIAMDVLHVSLLEKYVGLVEEQYGSPGMTDVEDLLQLAFQMSRVCPEIPGGNHVERALQQLADTFGSEGFARPGWAVQHGNEAFALALNYVVDALGGVILVGLYKGLGWTV